MFLFYILSHQRVNKWHHCDSFRQNHCFFMRKLNSNTALLQKMIKTNWNFALSIHSFTLRLRRSWLPWPWSGDRKILPTPGTNQIAGFSGYHPLTIKEINKYGYRHFPLMFIFVALNCLRGQDSTWTIGHFRITFSLFFIASLSAHSLIWK